MAGNLWESNRDKYPPANHGRKKPESFFDFSGGRCKRFVACSRSKLRHYKELPRAQAEEYAEEALAIATRQGSKGKSVTPFLLQEIARLSQGKTLRATIDLLVSNARLAGRISVAHRSEKKREP